MKKLFLSIIVIGLLFTGCTSIPNYPCMTGAWDCYVTLDDGIYYLPFFIHSQANGDLYGYSDDGSLRGKVEPDGKFYIRIDWSETTWVELRGTLSETGIVGAWMSYNYATGNFVGWKS